MAIITIVKNIYETKSNSIHHICNDYHRLYLYTYIWQMIYSVKVQATTLPCVQQPPPYSISRVCVLCTRHKNQGNNHFSCLQKKKKKCLKLDFKHYFRVRSQPESEPDIMNKIKLINLQYNNKSFHTNTILDLLQKIVVYGK